jgi:hypothetical protein
VIEGGCRQSITVLERTALEQDQDEGHNGEAMDRNHRVVPPPALPGTFPYRPEPGPDPDSIA